VAESFRDFELRGWEDPTICARYDDYFARLTTQSIADLLDGVRIGRSDTVLDVATGPGYVAGAVASRAAKVVGIDFSAQQLELARGRYPGITFQQGDADNLPFDSATFDVVLSNFGMPHFPDPERFLREAFRVLRGAGRVGFTTWDVPQEAKGLGAVYGAIQRHGSVNVGLPAGPNFFLFSDPKQCEQSLAGAGFEAISITKVRQTWELPGPDDLFEAVLNATVRAAATLKAQRPEALKAIRESVREAVAEYASGGVHRVPMPAVLATASKPQSAL
jgi:ubiquinone/menaquinone biosynthesis C-methylase UbiE